MYYLILTLLVAQHPIQPTFAGIYDSAETCTANALTYIELLEKQNSNIKVSAACLKSKDLELPKERI